MTSRRILPSSTRAGMVPGPPQPQTQTPLKARSNAHSACLSCRRRRSKCSGQFPCRKCVDLKVECIFAPPDTDRRSRSFLRSMQVDHENERRLLKEAVQELSRTLQELALEPPMNPERRSEVDEILAKYSPRGQETVIVESDDGLSGGERNSASRGETHKGTSRLASPGRQGELSHRVGLAQGNGVAGYLGKASEISWMRRAYKYLKQPSLRAHGPLLEEDDEADDPVTAAMAYYVDEAALLSINEDVVDFLAWPDFDVALILTEAAFDAMSGVFGFLDREQFLQTLIHFPRSNTLPSWKERRWLAVANLVWAVGTRWSAMILPSLPTNIPVDNHLVYYARSRALGLDHRVVFDHPDLQQTQAMGLLAFFLLMNNSISRAWTLSGSVIRHAVSLGLHLAVTDASMGGVQREERARTWYALYALEVLLAEITGRPKSITIADVTIPINVDLLQDLGASPPSLRREDPLYLYSRGVWLDFINKYGYMFHETSERAVMQPSTRDEEQHTYLQYAFHRLLLNRISDRIAVHLYAGKQDKPWSQFQRQVDEFRKELAQWANNLPAELKIATLLPSGDLSRQRLELNMYYHSVSMILLRPGLCDIHIQQESHTSVEWDRECARSCVQAAGNLVALIPYGPAGHEASRLLPWWVLLHYLSQATAVLVLELCLDGQHMPNGAKEIVPTVNAAMACLYRFTDQSLSAYKAWRIYKQMCSELSARGGFVGIDDTPGTGLVPLGWTEDQEMLVMNLFS